MNVEKLKRLQAQVRIGGKGTPRRKKKVTHQTAATDDKKLQSSLKKLSVSTIPGIEEVNIIKDDLTVIHFNNPKAQASLSANTFAVTGHGETKKVVEMLPEILPQLGQETVVQLRMFANSMTTGHNAKQKQTDAVTDDVVDDVPLLVEDFDQIAKQEASSESKVKPSAKPKNKTNSSTEDDSKLEKEPKSNQKQQISDTKVTNIEQNNQVIVETEKKEPFDEMCHQTVIPKQLEKPTEHITEKQGKQTKKPTMDKSGQIKDELQKGSNKAQNKDKKDTPASSGNKITQKQEVKRDLATAATTKGAPKDNSQKESQQSAKKNVQANANKNTQQGDSPKEAQQHKKNQNTQKQSVTNNQAPTKDKEPKEDVVENVTSEEEKLSKAPKDNSTTKIPLHSDKQSIEEKHSSTDLNDPNEEMIKPTEETHRSEEIKSTPLAAANPIKDLALPFAPIIPPQAKVLAMATPEVEKKLDTPLGFNKITDAITSASKETFATAVTGENQSASLKEITVPHGDITVESIQVEKIMKTDHQKPKNERAKLEETHQKIEPNETIVSPEIVKENQESAMKAKANPNTPSQQKEPGATKQQSYQKQNAPKDATSFQQSNQKQIASTTTKEPAKQQQKPAFDIKKSPTGAENKKDGETPKGKPAPAKPQLANSNNAAKPQSLQQPTQKTPAAGQQPCKTNEKPSAASKPTNTTKTPATLTATTSKKPGTTANPTASNSKPSNTASNSKNKPSTTANKPKVQAPQGPQKQGKPRLNVSSTTTASNPKATEKQTTPPTADVKAATPPQTTAKQ